MGETPRSVAVAHLWLRLGIRLDHVDQNSLPFTLPIRADLGPVNGCRPHRVLDFTEQGCGIDRGVDLLNDQFICCQSGDAGARVRGGDPAARPATGAQHTQWLLGQLALALRRQVPAATVSSALLTDRPCRPQTRPADHLVRMARENLIDASAQVPDLIAFLSSACSSPPVLPCRRRRSLPVWRRRESHRLRHAGLSPIDDADAQSRRTSTDTVRAELRCESCGRSRHGQLYFCRPVGQCEKRRTDRAGPAAASRAGWITRTLFRTGPPKLIVPGIPAINLSVTLIIPTTSDTFSGCTGAIPASLAAADCGGADSRQWTYGAHRTRGGTEPRTFDPLLTSSCRRWARKRSRRYDTANRRNQCNPPRMNGKTTVAGLARAGGSTRFAEDLGLACGRRHVGRRGRSSTASMWIATVSFCSGDVGVGGAAGDGSNPGGVDAAFCENARK